MHKSNYYKLWETKNTRYSLDVFDRNEIPFVTRWTKSKNDVYFRLNKYRKLVKYSNFWGAQVNILEIMKKKLFGVLCWLKCNKTTKVRQRIWKKYVLKRDCSIRYSTQEYICKLWLWKSSWSDRIALMVIQLGWNSVELIIEVWEINLITCCL